MEKCGYYTENIFIRRYMIAIEMVWMNKLIIYINCF